MPVLAAEPNLYPESLFRLGAELPHAAMPGEERCWHVVHTRPRQEKGLARQLLKLNVPFYLPTTVHRYMVRSRKVASHMPLFAGYVFLLADPRERLKAFETGRVVSTLHVADQPRLWHDLRQIEQLIALGVPITPEDRMAVGDEVVIRGGPLKGMSGTILRTATGHRFVVQVNFIQRGAAALLDAAMLAQAEL